MKIQIISRGTKEGKKTAEIVIKQNSKSQTRHVKQLNWSGEKYVDFLGNEYNLD